MSFDKFVKNLSEDQKKELLTTLKTSTDNDKQIVPKLVPKINDGSFTTSIKTDPTDGKAFGVPVTEMPRFNTFKDDGSDHKNKDNTTPDIELTERKRLPFKKITQTCTRCKGSVETHPQFYRDFYICDRCLKK